jgi:hypothetical protein
LRKVGGAEPPELRNHVFEFGEKLRHPIALSRFEVGKFPQQFARVIGKFEKRRTVAIDWLRGHV